MSALTIKIPEPIIDPATIIVASKRRRLGLNDVACSLIKTPVLINRIEDKYLFQIGLGNYFLFSEE
jgi:hypothetical protein